MVLSLLELFFNLNTYIFFKMKLKSLTYYSQRHLLCLKSLLFIINNMLCCYHNTGQDLACQTTLEENNQVKMIILIYDNDDEDDDNDRDKGTARDTVSDFRFPEPGLHLSELH